MVKPVETPVIAGKHPTSLGSFRASSQDAQREPSEPEAATLKLGETPPTRGRALVKPSQSPKYVLAATHLAAPMPGSCAAVPAEAKGWKDLPKTPSTKRRRSRELPSPDDSGEARLHSTASALCMCLATYLLCLFQAPSTCDSGSAKCSKRSQSPTYWKLLICSSIESRSVHCRVDYRIMYD